MIAMTEIQSGEKSRLQWTNLAIAEAAAKSADDATQHLFRQYRTIHVRERDEFVLALITEIVSRQQRDRFQPRTTPECAT